MKFLMSLSKKVWIIITSTVTSAAFLVVSTVLIVSNQYEARDLLPVFLEAKETLTFPESTKNNLTFDETITIGQYDIDISYVSSKPNRMDNLGNIINLPSQQEVFDDVMIIVTLSIDDAEYTYHVEIRIYGESKPVQVNIYDFDGKIMTINKKEGDILLLSELISPRKDGFTFAGFYLDLFYTESFGETLILEKDITIYAKYIEYQTLIIYGFDEILYMESHPKNTMIDLSSIILKSFEGYTFKSFKTLENTFLQNTSFALSENKIVIAVYEKNKYDIIFEIESIFEDALINVQGSFLYEETFGLPTLNSETHRIEGFYLDEAYTIPFTNTSTQLKSDLTIYIKVLQDVFKVTYIEQINDTSTTLKETLYKTGDEVSLSSILKENHIFLGWTLDDVFINNDTLEMLDQDIVLKASYISKLSIIETLNLNETTNKNLVLFSTIEINGFIFNAQYTSNYSEDISNQGVILRRPNIIEGNKIVSFTINITYKEQTFNYLYEVEILPITIEIEVTFIYLNGQTEVETYEFGDTIQLIEEKTYTDYEFDGYFLDPNFQIEATDAQIMNQDLNIYAKYTILRTITIVNIDGSITNLTYRDQSVVISDLIDFSLPKGYILEGYLKINNLSALEDTFTINSNMIIFPVFSLEVYTLTFVVEEGIFDVIDINNTLKFTAENQPGNLNFDNGIYQSIGFYLDEEFTIPYDNEVTYLEDLFVFIDYEQYQVIISLNIGQDVEYLNAVVFFVPLNGTIDSLAEPFKYGHTFLGWSIEDSDEIIIDLSSFEVNQDMSLVPNFDPMDNISIEFVLNNGESNVMATFEFNEIIQYPTLEKEGHTFNGWFEEGNLNNLYQPERIFEIEFKRLHAHWTVNTYELLITDDGVVLEQTILPYGTVLDIDLLDGEKEGYRFTGWSVEIPETMPAANLFIEAKYELILDLRYFVSLNNFPNQLIFFQDEDDSVTVFLIEGVLFGFGNNAYGILATEDLTLDTDSFEIDGESYGYNISKNLNLNFDEFILKINFFDNILYALTSENRLIRWGYTSGSYLPVEEVDIIINQVEFLLRDENSISVVTVLGDFFSYNRNNDKFDFTEEYSPYHNKAQFVNTIQINSLYLNNNIHDGFSIGYTRNEFIGIYDIDLELIFDVIDIEDTFSSFEYDISFESLLYIAIYGEGLDQPPLFVFDNYIVNYELAQYLSNVSLNPIAEIELNFLYGESIEEVLINEIEGVLVLSFYTTYGRILVPSISSELVEGTENLTFKYEDVSQYLILEGEYIIDIKEGFLLTNTNYLIDPTTFTYSSMNIIDFFDLLNDDEDVLADLISQSRMDVSLVADEEIIYIVHGSDSDFLFGGRAILLTNESSYFVGFSELRQTYFIYKDQEYFLLESNYEKYTNLTAQELLNYIPTTPENYRFDGWFVDSLLEIPATIDNLEDGLIIYPKFTQTHYQVQYFLYETEEYGLDDSNNLIDYIEGTYLATYEIGEIPFLPDLSLFGNYKEIQLNGDAYIINTLDFEQNESIPFEFDEAINNSVTIYLTYVYKTTLITVQFPDETEDDFIVATGSYLYDVIYFNDFLPVGMSVKGFYTDMDRENRINENYRVEYGSIFYVDYEETTIRARYIVEEIFQDDIVFEQYDFIMDIFQTQSGAIYLKTPNAWEYLTSPIINVSKEEYFMYDDYVNVTEYFSLLEDELIKEIVPIHTTASFYGYGNLQETEFTFFYAIITDMNRVFVSGSNDNEALVIDMVLIEDFEDKVIKGVSFSYQYSDQLFILLNDGTIHIYDFLLVNDVPEFNFNSLIETSIHTENVLSFMNYKNQLFLVTSTDFVIYTTSHQITTYDTMSLESDHFIDTTLFWSSDRNDENFTIYALSQQGLRVSYTVNLYNERIQTHQIDLIENERFEHLGIIQFSFDDEFGVIGITNLNRMSILESEEMIEHGAYFTFDEVISIDYTMILKNGNTIYFNSHDELVRDTSIDIGNRTIEKSFVNGYLKLSDGNYFNLNGEYDVYIKTYRFLDEEAIEYNISSKPELNDSLEPNAFFGWTIIMTEMTNIDNATILTEMPVKNTLIYALLND